MSVAVKHSSARDARMLRTYEDLARTVVAELYKPTENNCQTWIAIAGGPGSGKSTLAAALVERVNALCKTGAGNDVAVCLPMDGFHLSRQQLQEIAEKHGKDGVTFQSLLSRRGSPWTFDVDQLVSRLNEAKISGEGIFPTYSRVKSDPVWEPSVRLEKYHQIVFVEGNYLLNYDEELVEFPGQKEGKNLQDATKWKQLQFLFDERWFIRCESLEIQRERLISRHLETWTEEKTKMFGEGKCGGAAKKADTNDVLNAQFVELHRRWATREIVSL